MSEQEPVRIPRVAGRRSRHGHDDDNDLTPEEIAAIEAAYRDEVPSGRHGSHSLRESLDNATLPAALSGVPLRSDAPSSKAGRNLPAAIGVGVGLGAIILATLWLWRPGFVVIVCIAVVYALYELTTGIATVEARVPLIPLVVGGLAMDIAAWYRGSNGLVAGLLLTVIAVAIWRLADGSLGYLRDLSAAVLCALYVPLLAGFAVLLVHPHDGAGRVVAFILTVVCSDVGGYATGVLFGRHPMAPTVSPKKSWEGFAGSLIACVACGSLLMALVFHEQWWKGALFGLAIVVTATLGDLGESMIKRDLGLKDMGRLLPGHGGLMDRMDSLLPCAAVAYLILIVAVPT
ncbi:MAG: phosphatidate cytidylyltransferase [Jatrophihabitans sp.]